LFMLREDLKSLWSLVNAQISLRLLLAFNLDFGGCRT